MPELQPKLIATNRGEIVLILLCVDYKSKDFKHAYGQKALCGAGKGVLFICCVTVSKTIRVLGAKIMLL